MLYAPHRQQCTLRKQGIPDGALVKLALAGDQSAFDVLVQRYRTMLTGYIGGFFRDSEQVSDVLQHVFLHLYLSLPILLTNVSLHVWLFQVARNRCLDELRRQRRHASVPFSMLAWEDGEEEQSVVAALPPKFRSIVFLHCFRQLTFPEIGRLLHLPPSTVKTYYYRSLPHLHRMLAADAHFASAS